jgi:hypothetical protein
VTVYSHGITKNFWEYYFLDSKPDSRQNMCALVMGFEQEMGDVHVPEVQPYLMTYTKNMNNIAPAEGWEWVD